MKSNELFNGLNGCQNVDRSEIIDIIELAKQENNTDVIYRLSKILNANPDADIFNIEIRQFTETGLNGSRHTGDYREALDECGRLNKGYRFENGKVVKVAPKVKPVKKTATKTPKAKKTASNYGKKSKRETVELDKLQDFEIQIITDALNKKFGLQSSIKNSFESKDKNALKTAIILLSKYTGMSETFLHKHIKEIISLPIVEEKPAVKKKTTSIVGYMLKDSISGEVVASKKELKDLETVYYNLEENEIGKDLEIFVYQIIKRNGKNVQGKRVLVDWKKIKIKPAVKKTISNENNNPKSFDIKPKSVSVTTAINDVLGLEKFKGKVKPLVATLLHKKFKNDLDNIIDLESEYEIAILKKDSLLHTSVDGFELFLTSLGIDFVKAVNGRLESLKNQKNNYALFDGLAGTKKQKPALNSAVQEKEIAKPISNNPAVSKAGVRSVQNSEFYKVNGSTGEFLQRVEKKPKESVVITIDGEQGAGKTTMLYNYIEDFASAGNSSIFLTLEEHKDSELATEKVNKYLSQKAKNNLDMASDIDSVEAFYKIVACYDIIFIDSWQKLLRLIGNIRLDEDLRKKFDGKVFIIIFQQTTTGRTKGGSEVVFDGDIIIKMVKENSFTDNYAYFDKNRYTKIPIENIRYNIANRKVYNPNQIEAQKQEVQPKETIQFSFNTK